MINALAIPVCTRSKIFGYGLGCGVEMEAKKWLTINNSSFADQPVEFAKEFAVAKCQCTSTWFASDNRGHPPTPLLYHEISD
jgi:hypothetical protein